MAREIIGVAGVTTLYTYPHAVFADETGQIQNAHLEVFYNGRLSFKVGETVYMPDLPTQGCRVTRTGASERHPGDGLIPLVPTYTLKGRENNEVTLTIPANGNQKVVSAAGVYNAKVVLWLEGFKIVGAGGASQP